MINRLINLVVAAVLTEDDCSLFLVSIYVSISCLLFIVKLMS